RSLWSCSPGSATGGQSGDVPVLWTSCWDSLSDYFSSPFIWSATPIRILGINQRALNATTLIEKVRYKPAQRAHNPALVQYAFGAGDDWRGFAAAKELNDIAPGIVLIDLPRPTQGHAAVAVEVAIR